MHIQTIGLNFKTAPIAVRERFAFLPDRLPQALRTLRAMENIAECVILSTCNRMEIYTVCEQKPNGPCHTEMFLEQWFGVPQTEFANHLYKLDHHDAVVHLFEVACGLNSMVVGETQILGQVREAMEAAQAAGTTGTRFNRLFQVAVTVGKRAHSETEIGQNAVSVSYAAIELGKKIFGAFHGKTVLILGAGKMSELTAQHLQSHGAKSVLVVNRTKERAYDLANRFHGQVFAFEQLEEALQKADVVIASTGSDQVVVETDHIREAMQHRRHRALFLIDIAVPRDIDPAVNETRNVFLYDIDDLHDIVEVNKEERMKEAEKVSAFINEAVSEYSHWLQTLEVVPVIAAVREKAMGIQEETMQRIERKLPDLTERERRILHKQTKSIVNQLLRDPIARMKEMAADADGGEDVCELFAEIFALEALLAEEETDSAKKTEPKAHAGTSTYLTPLTQIPVRSS